MDVARKGGSVGRRRVAALVGACTMGGAAALAGVGGATVARATATEAPLVSREVTILSPQPDFVALNGNGLTMSSTRVAWTASSGQGPLGSEIDRIYTYDLARGRSGAPVNSSYGKNGAIGNYTLAGDTLAYVDTGFAPGGIFAWRVCLTNLRAGRTLTLAVAPRASRSAIPPYIAFDGAHLLMLQSVPVGAGGLESEAVLLTPGQRRQQVLQRARNVTFGDPALAHGAALWTTIVYGSHGSSRLTSYDMRRHAVRTVPVGDVSQLSASGDLVAWKSGPGTMPTGHIGLYSLSAGRLLSSDLAHGDAAIFPSIHGRLISWTYGNTGSRVQVYSLGSHRVIYSAPMRENRIYGLTAASDSAVAWVYTDLPTGHSPARGYVVVHPVR